MKSNKPASASAIDSKGVTLEGFLDRLAARTPTPGGGALTGWVGAMGCALGRMVAAYSIKEGMDAEARAVVESAAARLHRCDMIFRALAFRDEQAYQSMTDARRNLRTRPEGAAAKSDYEEAVREATLIPLEMAALAVEGLATLDESKAAANVHLLSDLAIAADLLEATVRTAGHTLRVNVPQLSESAQRQKLTDDLQRILHRTRRLHESANRFVGARFENPAASNR